MKTSSALLPIRLEGIQPILMVNDMATSRAFYVKTLGFYEEEWGDDNFTSVRRDDAAIYLCKGAQGNPGTWIWVGFDGDIYKLYEMLLSRGVTVLRPPANYSWAQEIHIVDPDGHVLRFGTEPDPSKPFLDKQN